MTGLKELWELQGLDEVEANLERQLKRIPELKELRVLKGDIEERQEKYRELKEELADVKKRLKKEEDVITATRMKIEKASSELYSGEINTAKELETAEKNINGMKETLANHEDEALGFMDMIETAEEEIKQAASELNDMKERFAQLSGVYKSKKENLAKELARTVEYRDQLKGAVPPELFERYRKLSGKFQDGKPLAVLEKGVCSGCHMGVSFDLLKKAKTDSHNLRCDNCGRMLFVE